MKEKQKTQQLLKEAFYYRDEDEKDQELVRIHTGRRQRPFKNDMKELEEIRETHTKDKSRLDLNEDEENGGMLIPNFLLDSIDPDVSHEYTTDFLKENSLWSYPLLLWITLGILAESVIDFQDY
eukprot:CAMPEP_0194147604 /NCGR_PEP_ID=MMETSP0152-20130528/26371_1 /TAXON_ID=1049557 /ORGANISM="Thalassiothrix antarctica, Strain L6-D1" /LENGTH=123 /DNA_ID=CAMNT_0038848547 /DNA_START=111 /DNA_END=479 /DNA_ORIENTATION=-